MRVSRVTVYIFLISLLVTSFLFKYLFVVLTPVSNRIVETQRDLLFRQVIRSSEMILNENGGEGMLKAYLNRLKKLATNDLVNVEIEDEGHHIIWSAIKGESKYYKLAKLQVSGSASSPHKEYFLKIYFSTENDVFSVPWLVLSVVLFLGFFVLYELVLSLINSGLCLSRWCYKRNLYFWSQGDFSQLAFVPARYSDQSTQQQMFLVQSINEIFSFLQRRCHVLQNSTGSSEIVDACHQLLDDAKSQDKLTSRCITMLTAWAPMTELRWMTLLLSCQLSIMLELNLNSLFLVLFLIILFLSLGSVVANTVTYRYSRRFVGFLSLGLSWIGVLLFWKYHTIGTTVAAFAVGLFCHSLSLVPDSQKEIFKYIIPHNETLNWPIKYLLGGFFIPVPLFYVLLERVSHDNLSFFPAVLLFVTSFFLWRYVHRNPVWRYSMVPAKSYTSFFHASPPLIVLFFCFAGGGLSWILFYQTSHFLSVWFIVLACLVSFFSYLNNNLILRRLLFSILGIFLLCIPILSGFWVNFLSRDAQIFTLSLITSMFIDVSYNHDNLMSNLYSLRSVFAILFGGIFFYLVNTWNSLSLSLAIFSVFGGVLLYQYWEKFHDN